jgi:hypothetical protein
MSFPGSPASGGSSQLSSDPRAAPTSAPAVVSISVIAIAHLSRNVTRREVGWLSIDEGHSPAPGPNERVAFCTRRGSVSADEEGSSNV